MSVELYEKSFFKKIVTLDFVLTEFFVGNNSEITC